MRYTEQEHQDHLKTIRELDEMIRDRRRGDLRLAGYSMKELLDMRDEIFLKIEMTTVDHVVALGKLKRELGLKTNYKK